MKISFVMGILGMAQQNACQKWGNRKESNGKRAPVRAGLDFTFLYSSYWVFISYKGKHLFIT